MHYRNGREAKNGDKIVKLGWDGKIEAFGVLHSATPGNDYCNGTLQPSGEYACMCDCLHVDDVASILAERGLDKRPDVTSAPSVGKDRILQFFGYQHLPPAMQEISRPFGQLAAIIADRVPSNPERTVALRKLLEAKDAAVRAGIYKEPAEQ